MSQSGCNSNPVGSQYPSTRHDGRRSSAAPGTAGPCRRPAHPNECLASPLDDGYSYTKNINYILY